MTTIKTQNFGVEIELTGITRENAAKVIADHYGTTAAYLGTYYRAYGATDTKGRTWKAMSDGSIRCVRKVNGRTVSASGDYSCEVVTPILQYDDLDDLQEIVRKLRAHGAIANESTGIHVHVDGANHDFKSMTRLVNFFTGRQDLFYEALQIGERANHWCQKTSKELLNAAKKTNSNSDMERAYYSRANGGYCGGIDHSHYCPARYRGLNLHAFFTKGTIEFRLFNGTTHAGKIKAYVQFCLAMSAWAINCDSDHLYFKGIGSYTVEQKAALMDRMLQNRLGLKGAEFKNARKHLCAGFEVAGANGETA